jgi:hypothetical protein
MTIHSIENNSYFNIDNCRSYASEKNLYKAINDLGLTKEQDTFLVVCNRKGRYTAIFSPNSPRLRDGGFIALYSQYGFMTF